MSSSGDRTGGAGANAGATVGAGHGSGTGAGAGATAGAGSVTAVPSKPRTFDVEEDRAAVMRLAVPFAGGAATIIKGSGNGAGAKASQMKRVMRPRPLNRTQARRSRSST